MESPAMSFHYDSHLPGMNQEEFLCQEVWYRVGRGNSTLKNQNFKKRKNVEDAYQEKGKPEVIWSCGK